MLGKVWRRIRDSYWMLGTFTLVWLLYKPYMFARELLLFLLHGVPYPENAERPPFFPIVSSSTSIEYDEYGTGVGHLGHSFLDEQLSLVWEYVFFFLLLLLVCTAYYHARRDHYGKYLVHSLFMIISVFGMVMLLIPIYFLICTSIVGPFDWITDNVPLWLFGVEKPA